MRLAVPTTKNTNEVGNSKQDDWTGQKIKTFLCSSDIYFSSRAVWPDGKIIYSSFDCLEKGKIAQWLEIFAKVGSKYSQVKLNLKYCPRLLQFYQSSEIWPNLVTLIRVLWRRQVAMNDWIGQRRYFGDSWFESSVTRWLDCLFNLLPFSKMKICPMELKIWQRRLKSLPNT